MTNMKQDNTDATNYWVTKNFVTLMFSSISLSQKKKIFFWETKKFYVFLCVLDPGNHFMKSRPASSGQNLHVEKF